MRNDMQNLDGCDWTDDEPENGYDLREGARQSISNALDMMSLSADFWGRDSFAIVLQAPAQLGLERFKAAAAVVAAHVESKSLPRWRIAVGFDRPGKDLGASLVLIPNGPLQPEPEQTIDFLGGLGVRPED